MLVVSPQLEAGGDWDVARLDRLLADVRRAYRVDPARLYLTGLSLGGMATWRWALARPELFAAIAPVAAKTPTEGACRVKDLPIWAFHGDRDPNVPVRGNFEMVEAVRGCGGSVAPRLTVYPDTDHFSWVPAYDDAALWRWLAEQRRTTAPSK
jgi:predicted peptidase